MRSSNGRRAAWVVAIVCMAASAFAISLLRPRLAVRYHSLKVTSDVYALPPPEHALLTSLGWRAAFADVLYAHVLVSYGLHFQEKRRFEFVGNYLDTINTLDPKFRDPYLFADTLLTLQPKPPRREDYLKARQILERGMQEFPYDARLWTTAGQYLAYLAPPHLGDETVKAEWRREGARRLSRACELVSDNENLPYHCITAASLLSQAGNREATVEFLERVLAVSDDEEIQKLALGYLAKAIGERTREQAESRQKRFREAWSKDLGFVTKDRLLVLGPRVDSARCAGRQEKRTSDCASTWQDWMRDQEPAVESEAFSD